jgi:hypothetical protein
MTPPIQRPIIPANAAPGRYCNHTTTSGFLLWLPGHKQQQSHATLGRLRMAAMQREVILINACRAVAINGHLHHMRWNSLTRPIARIHLPLKSSQRSPIRRPSSCRSVEFWPSTEREHPQPMRAGYERDNCPPSAQSDFYRPEQMLPHPQN